MRLLRLVILVLFLAGVLSCATPGYGQGTTQYIYDANGRLTGVITPSGDAAVYHYDPAGNITAIERIGSGSFTILSFTPQVATIGDSVTLTGVGLDTASSVSFNGTPAQIVSATPGSLVALVPDGASTGLITLSGVRGTATTATAFQVVGRVVISPSLAEILPGESVQFQATVIGTPNQQVTWSVNGIAGGNGAIGTIDGNGFYQSPNVNHGLTVAVSATSQVDTLVVGQATVRIVNPNTASEVRASGVSVSVGLGKDSLVVALPVSVAHSRTPGDIVTSPTVSVAVGRPLQISSAAVSVGAGGVPGITSQPLAVEVGAPRSILFASPVSETTGPVINTISPATLTRGSSTTVTVTGQNLGGTTSVSFAPLSGGFDPNVTVTNISSSSDGTTLTFTAVIAANATAGSDIVFVFTPNGPSVAANGSSNTVQVQ